MRRAPENIANSMVGRSCCSAAAQNNRRSDNPLTRSPAETHAQLMNGQSGSFALPLLDQSVYNSAMNSVVRVASPPARPVMIYDGDCRFCTLWIRRWQIATGDRVEYLPYQDPRVVTQFPEIACEQFEAAVQLVQPDGAVYAAAEAVFRSLATNRCGRF